MKYRLFLFVFAFSALSTATAAENARQNLGGKDPSTNRSSNVTFRLPLIRDTSSFWYRVEEIYERRTRIVFENSLRSVKSLKWQLRLQDHDDLGEKYERTAGSAFVRSVSYSMRELVVETPLVVRSRSAIEERFGFLGRFLSDSFSNSLAAVDEDEIRVHGASFVVTDRTWLEGSYTNSSSGVADKSFLSRLGRLYDAGVLRPGANLFHENPYVFVTSRIQLGGETWLIAHVRYRAMHLIGDHRVETLLSVPLHDGFYFDTGFSFEPWVKKDKERLSFRVTKRWGRGARANAFFVGYEPREARILSGLAFDWP
ncbi:MAG TPA: hypothetical protein VI981_03465 [Candidatus Paceibacterota bacterium]